jgi:hypothetical protein
LNEIESAVGWIFEKSLGSHNDMCIGLLSNELDTSREYDVDTRFRPHRTTSTAFYCKRQADIVFKELCWMTNDVLLSVLMTKVSKNFQSQFTIMTSKPPSLAQILNQLFIDDTRFKKPGENSITSRIAIATRICNTFYSGSNSGGSFERSIEDVLKLNPKAQKKSGGGDASDDTELRQLSEKLVRAMSGDTSNPTVKSTIVSLNADIMKLQKKGEKRSCFLLVVAIFFSYIYFFSFLFLIFSLESCNKIKKSMQKFKLLLMNEKKKKNKQKCYTCLRTIRPLNKLSSNICDNENIYSKQPMNILDNAFTECGVSMSTFLKDSTEGKGSSSSSSSGKSFLRRRRRLLMNPSDLAISLTLSSDLNSGSSSSIVGNGSPTSLLIKKLHDQRLKDSTLPTTCGDTLYPPKSMEIFDAGLKCVQKFLLDSSHSTTESSTESTEMKTTNIGSEECNAVVQQVKEGTKALAETLSTALGRSYQEIDVGDGKKSIVSISKAYHKMRRYAFVNGVERKVSNGGSSNDDSVTSVIVNRDMLQRDRCLSDTATACCDLHYCTEEDESNVFQLFHNTFEQSNVSSNEDDDNGGENGMKKNEEILHEKKMEESPPGFGGVVSSAGADSTSSGSKVITPSTKSRKPSSTADSTKKDETKKTTSTTPSQSLIELSDHLREEPKIHENNMIDYINRKRLNDALKDSLPYYDTFKMNKKNQYYQYSKTQNKKGDKHEDQFEKFILTDVLNDPSVKKSVKDDNLSGLNAVDRNELLKHYQYLNTINKYEYLQHKHFYDKIHASRIEGQSLERSIEKRKDLLPGVRQIGIGIRSWSNSNCNRVFGTVPDGLELPPIGLAQKYSIPSGLTVQKRDETITSDLLLIDSFRDIVSSTIRSQESFIKGQDDDRIDVDGKNVLHPKVLKSFNTLAKGNVLAKYNLNMIAYTIGIAPGALSFQAKVRAPGSLLRFSNHIFENDASTMTLIANDKSDISSKSVEEMDEVINENSYYKNSGSSNTIDASLEDDKKDVKDTDASIGLIEKYDDNMDGQNKDGRNEDDRNKDGRNKDVTYKEEYGSSKNGSSKDQPEKVIQNPLRVLRDHFQSDKQFRDSICWDIDDHYQGVQVSSFPCSPSLRLLLRIFFEYSSNMSLTFSSFIPIIALVVTRLYLDRFLYI